MSHGPCQPVTQAFVIFQAAKVELASFPESSVRVWSLFSVENEHLLSDRKKRTFREFGKFAVLSTFSAQKGAVTLTGDIGKTFSRMENLAVLEGFSANKRK